MSPSEVFQAAGGGIVGLLVVAVFALAVWIVRMYEARLGEHKEIITTLTSSLKDQTTALNQQTVAMTRLTDILEAKLDLRLKA